jgi:hypothetical protein
MKLGCVSICFCKGKTLPMCARTQKSRHLAWPLVPRALVEDWSQFLALDGPWASIFPLVSLGACSVRRDLQKLPSQVVVREGPRR